jgi:sodium-dependent dicarboxylate transporter 2/3/5
MSLFYFAKGPRIHKLLRNIILAAAVLAAYIIMIQPVPQGLTPEGLKAIAVFVLCVILWVTNALPLMITSLLAILLFPLLNILDTNKAYALFGNQAVFFILGAFILASGLMRSGLSTRLAVWILGRFGHSQLSLVGWIMLVGAFMSFWISAHAVAAMMFPIVSEINDSMDLDFRSNYAKTLFLAMGWGCIIGGTTTILGGGRAALALGILYELTGRTLSFMEWTLAALPMVVVTLGVFFLGVTRIFPWEELDIKNAHEQLVNKVSAMGPVSRKESGVGALMLGAIFFWIFFGIELGLANIALMAVVAGFVFRLIEWREVEEDVNWGIFLMYGGAICLGFAMEKTGASAWVAHRTLGRIVYSPWMLFLSLSFVSIFLTEAISNSAVVALLMPIAISLARVMSLDPRVLTLALTVPSGLALLFPMGNPATAIAFSSGYLRKRDTLIFGIFLKILALVVFNLMAYYYWPLIGLKL